MKTSRILLVCTLLLSNLVCFAEGEPTGFGDDVQDVPADAPIDGWIYVVMIIAIYYGYKSIMRAAKTDNSKEA